MALNKSMHGAEAWFQRLVKGLESGPISVTTQLRISDDRAKLVLQELGEERVYTEAMRLVLKRLLGNNDTWSLRKQFDKGAKDPESLPEFLTKHKRNVGRREMKRAKVRYMRKGFADLWENISVNNVATNGGRVMGTVGPREAVERLRMSDYMPITGTASTASSLNTLFYGVEYGTGIEKNVGPGNVRLANESGTKDTSGRDPGAWWLGDAENRGVKIRGQKGFHFLYDERTRMPREGYAKAINLWFGEAIREALK